MNDNAAPGLVLTVLGDHAGDLAQDVSVRADGHDLSIGRAEHCDWILHAKGVSRQHAFIRHLHGLYFIEDRSTNGMLLNGTPLRGNEPAALASGDRLQLDTFEILVAIQTHPDDTLQPAQTERTVPPPAAPDAPLLPGMAGGPAVPPDPLEWLQSDESAAGPLPAPAGLGVSWTHASPLDDRFAQPRVESRTATGGAVLPENWDRTRSLFQMPAFAAAPANAANGPVEAPAAPSPAVVPDAHAAPAPATPQPNAAPDSTPAASATATAAPRPELIESLLTLVLDGVMDVLRARAELKNGFRLPATLIQRRENNPLKFAPTANEALVRVLAAPNEAFLSGEAAITDAMDDIRMHQVALLAGVRGAFEDLMAQLDPARFEEGEHGRRRFALGAGHGAWRRYREHFERLSADPEARFRQLFGDEFARTYEDHLARSKTTGHEGN